MTPHLHPRSRSTASLFAATLFASFIVVGLPHLFPCPAPRRTLADSEMAIAGDAQSTQRLRRQRRKENPDNPYDNSSLPPSSSQPPLRPTTDEEYSEMSTFLQLEAEAEKLSKNRRECPVPKPGGIIGELLGFKGRERGREDGQE